jgi:hypothetical protein
MRRLIQKVMLAFLIVSLFSCLTTAARQADAQTITARVETNDAGDVYLVINWDSRSRVTLAVVGALKNELLKLKDRIVMAKGRITERSEWSGTMEVWSYELSP